MAWLFTGINSLAGQSAHFIFHSPTYDEDSGQEIPRTLPKAPAANFAGVTTAEAPG